MKTELKTFEADGAICTALVFHNQHSTPAGTVWRFVLQKKTLVANPSMVNEGQLEAHTVPERIESILGGPHGMGAFGDAVAHVAWSRTAHNFGRVWEHEINEATEAELKKIKSKEEREQKRTAIEAKHRKKIDKQKAQLMLENRSSASDHLKKSLAALGIKKFAEPQIEALIDHIYKLLEGRGHDPTIRHADYERIIQKAEELTKRKLSKAVRKKSLSAYGLQQGQISERTRFIAVFADGHRVPLDLIQYSIYDMKEMDWAEKITEADDFSDSVQKSNQRLEDYMKKSKRATARRLGVESHQETKVEDYPDSAPLVYERKRRDGTTERIPHSENVFTKKRLLERLIADGKLIKNEKEKYIYEDTKNPFDSHLRSCHENAFKRIRDPKSNNYYLGSEFGISGKKC